MLQLTTHTHVQDDAWAHTYGRHIPPWKTWYSRKWIKELKAHINSNPNTKLLPPPNTATPLIVNCAFLGWNRQPANMADAEFLLEFKSQLPCRADYSVPHTSFAFILLWRSANQLNTYLGIDLGEHGMIGFDHGPQAVWLTRDLKWQCNKKNIVCTTERERPTNHHTERATMNLHKLPRRPSVLPIGGMWIRS